MKFAPLFLLIAACANADAAWETQGLRFQDEGVHKGYATAVNCAGAGITCAVSGGKATLTVPGGGGTGTPGGIAGNIQVNDGLGAFSAYPGVSCPPSTYFTDLDSSGNGTCTQVTTGQLSGTITDAQLANNYSGVGACLAGRFASTLVDNAGPTCTQVAYTDVSGTPTIPADISGASYITKVAEAGLSNEFALGSLATGLLKNTTTTGVPTIAASGTDYAPATSGSVILLGNGAGAFSNYGGATSCTNQFFTGLSSAGASTCTTATLAGAQFANQGTTTTLLHGNAAGNPSFAGVSLANDTAANQGTTTTVLHGNAAGQPTFAAVSLTADVSGTLPAANGGTGTTQGNGGCVTLGSATAAAVTVGPVTWTGTFNNLFINYEIVGYNGGTPVGRILLGVGSISTTALTNGTSAYEGVAGVLTNSVSIPGAPLAVTLSAIGRSGTFHLTGRSGAIKRYWIEGQNGNASVSAVSTVYRAVGNFSDLGTNLPIQRAQLTVYDTLATTSASTNTFTTGTTITVIGCP